LLDDIRLIDTGGEQVLVELAYLASSQLQAVKIYVNFQKNGDNGQELTKAANHEDPQLCCMLRQSSATSQAMSFLVGPGRAGPSLGLPRQ
jgi:hypothetical protein